MFWVIAVLLSNSIYTAYIRKDHYCIYSYKILSLVAVATGFVFTAATAEPMSFEAGLLGIELR